MISESDIRLRLIRVLQNQDSVDSFAEWLAAARQNAHRDSPRSAQDLAAAISLLLYEHDDGILDDLELREELTVLAEIVRSTFSFVDANAVIQPVRATASLAYLQQPVGQARLQLT